MVHSSITSASVKARRKARLGKSAQGISYSSVSTSWRIPGEVRNHGDVIVCCHDDALLFLLIDMILVLNEWEELGFGLPVA